jgi:hypothetical protein
MTAGHYGCLLRNGGDLTNERLIDLQRIDGKFSEVAQARVAGAEVIDRELYPSSSECLENGFGRLGMPHQHAFGQPQFQRFRIQSRVPEGCEYTFQKRVVTERIAEMFTAMVPRVRPESSQMRACWQASRRTHFPTELDRCLPLRG